MGIYVQPVEVAEETGREGELCESFEEAQKQLEENEVLCAISFGNSLSGKIALVISNAFDYKCVKKAPERIIQIRIISTAIVPELFTERERQ